MTAEQKHPAAPAEQDFGQMMAMVTGYWVSQVVRAAAVFHIAGHIANGVVTAEEIAEVEATDPDATGRLLRALASLGLLTSEDGVRFAATSLLDTLHPDTPNSLHYFAKSQAAPGHWKSWGLFPDAVREGKTQTSAAHGVEGWDYFVQNPEEGRDFTISMQNLSGMVSPLVAQQLDTKGVKLAMDVGGASGSLVRELMRANPDLKGAVLDRPDVVAEAATVAEAEGLADRFSVVGGDFFVEVPEADMYLLRYVLHDWDDEECVQILSNCRKSLADGGRVVLVELLVGEVGTPGLAPLMDANMLVMTGGRERDIAQYDALFAKAGLRRTGVTPAGSMAIIEAVAATPDTGSLK